MSGETGKVTAEPVACGNCDGSGYDIKGVKSVDKSKSMNRVCHACNGTGRIPAPSPEGAVVPREPLMGQWDDFCKASGVTVEFGQFVRGYRAMLAAAAIKEKT